MRVTLCVALCGVLLLSVGCTSGVTMADYEALSLGMTLEELESSVGMELVVVEEEAVGARTLTVGYFGVEDGPRIAVVLTDGEATMLTPVELE